MCPPVPSLTKRAIGREVLSHAIHVISDVIIGDGEPVFCFGWVEADGSLVEMPECKGLVPS